MVDAIVIIPAAAAVAVKWLLQHQRLRVFIAQLLDLAFDCGKRIEKKWNDARVQP